VTRGEIWWVEDPQSGRRPFLLLTRDEAIPVLRAVIGIPASRTVRRIRTEVPLGPEDGMPTECVLSCDNPTVLPKAFFTERICSLRGERMHEVCGALAVATGCS
jgi:mRNA interferase MazF